MSQLYINIPKIAITPEDEENDDDDSNLLNLAEALTDVEELFEDHVASSRNSLRKKLKIKVSDNDGYNTALEDVEASDDDNSIPMIIQHNFPISIEDIDMEQYSTEEKYGIPEELKNRECLKLQSSYSNETLPRNSIEYSDDSHLTDVEYYDTENDSADDINIPDYEIHADNCDATHIIKISDDIQDKQQAQLDQNFLECNTPLTATVFPSSLFEEKVIKQKKRPPTFSQMMKGKGSSAHTRMRKKKRNKITRKLNEQKVSDGSDSSENEPCKSESVKFELPIYTLNYESDVEEENKLQFPICKKTFTKVKQHLQMPEYDLNAKTDEEDFECDAETYRRRKSVDTAIFQNQLDEMASCYSFTKDKNEEIEMQGEEKEKLEYYSLDANATNVTDQYEDKIVEPTKKLCISAPTFEEGALTDIENISDCQEHEPIDTIDQGVISDYDTEEEIFKGIPNDINVLPDIILPPPTRTLVIAEENRSLIPTVRILPLDDNVRTDSEFEEATTDDESMNSANELTIKTGRDVHSPQLPFMEGENVKMSENSINPLHGKSMIEDVATDVEDLDGEIPKVIKKVGNEMFLSPNKPTVRYLTDFEEIEMSDCQSGKISIGSEIEGHTDLEYLDSSDEDTFARTELQGNKKSCMKLKFPALVMQGLTDTEDLAASTDDEINYSRAETATPHEIKKEFDYISSIHIDSENSSKIDYAAPEEVMYLKGGGFQEIHTDIELIIDDAEPHVQEVMDAWEYFKQFGETSQSSEPVDTTTSKVQQELSSEKGDGAIRQQPVDQHQLSSEMKNLLKEMEEASKK